MKQPAIKVGVIADQTGPLSFVGIANGNVPAPASLNTASLPSAAFIGTRSLSPQAPEEGASNVPTSFSVWVVVPTPLVTMLNLPRRSCGVPLASPCESAATAV